jgi:hypothetical protein
MKAARVILISALLGIVLRGADSYFGVNDGRFAFCVLGVLLPGGLLFDFYSSAQSLMHPRRLDTAFVGAMDYAGRVKEALRNAKAAGFDQTIVPVLSGLMLGLTGRHSPPFIAAALAVFPLESLLVTLLLMAIIRFGALPVSGRKFAGSNRRDTQSLPAVPFFLDLTHRLAKSCSAWIPGRYAWIFRRKLIHLFRADPVFLIIYVAFLSALGFEFMIHWSLIASVTYALTACMLSLTLVQLASTEGDESYRQLAFLMPGEEVKFRFDLLLMLLTAAVFVLYFAAAAFLHKGRGEEWVDISLFGNPRGFWQAILTLAVFPLLLMAEKAGTVKTTDARVVLNFCYLGLAASLFMFPFLGTAIVAAIGAVALARCLRMIRPAVADARP